MRVNGSARSNTGAYGESHSLVLHELWVLVFAGSNPVSPTNPPKFDGLFASGSNAIR